MLKIINNNPKKTYLIVILGAITVYTLVKGDTASFDKIFSVFASLLQ